MKLKKIGAGVIVAGALVTGFVQTSEKICGYSENNMWEKVNQFNDEETKRLNDQGCKNVNAETKSVGNFCSEVVITCKE